MLLIYLSFDHCYYNPFVGIVNDTNSIYSTSIDASSSIKNKYYVDVIYILSVGKLFEKYSYEQRLIYNILNKYSRLLRLPCQ